MLLFASVCCEMCDYYLCCRPSAAYRILCDCENANFWCKFFVRLQQITQLKEKGNKALAENKFDEAIAAYTEAISFDGKNHVLFSNRSAAFAKAGKYEEALKDANETVQLNPTWPKGYSRKGSALSYLQKYAEAFEAYREGEWRSRIVYKTVVLT